MTSNREVLDRHTIEFIKEVCQSFNSNDSSLIAILHKIQEKLGCLPVDVQNAIAQELSIPVKKVHGVVSFYSFFSDIPKGRHTISVCSGTACHANGSEKLLGELKKILDINIGETTPDGQFTLDSSRCIGACGLAPVLIIDNKLHKLTSINDIRGIISEYAQNR